MSPKLWNKASWLLVVTVGTLTSSEPAGKPCSIADLDGDCDVDLRDYELFQREFSGATSFELVGPTWDVFHAHDTLGWTYTASFVFYRNGTIGVGSPFPGSFFFYEFDGELVTIDWQLAGDEGWCEGLAHIELSFAGAGELTGDTICNGVPLESLWALRRE